MQKAHLALIDALMTLAAKETVGRVKMAVEAEQTGVGAPWENALLFWVNRVRPQNHGSTRGSVHGFHLTNTRGWQPMLFHYLVANSYILLYEGSWWVHVLSGGFLKKIRFGLKNSELVLLISYS